MKVCLSNVYPYVTGIQVKNYNIHHIIILLKSVNYPSKFHGGEFISGEKYVRFYS